MNFTLVLLCALMSRALSSAICESQLIVDLYSHSFAYIDSSLENLSFKLDPSCRLTAVSLFAFAFENSNYTIFTSPGTSSLCLIENSHQTITPIPLLYDHYYSLHTLTSILKDHGYHNNGSTDHQHHITPQKCTDVLSPPPPYLADAFILRA